MTQRIPNTESPTEVRQAFQRLVGDTDIITAGGVGEVLIGGGIGVAPTWSTELTTLTLLTVDNITIDAATITSDSGAISFANENLTTTGTVTAGQILVDNLILDGATIESNTGAISFGDENLSTAGTITGINVTSGADPGHTHTGASVSGLDISSDTNLAVVAPIVLTDDELSLDQTAVDHDVLTNTHNLTTDIDHNALTNYAANQHVVLPGLIAAVLTDHNLAAHTALGLFDQHTDVDHDQTTNYVVDKHVAHSGVTLTAGSGISGGGTIEAGRTFDLDINSLAATAIAAGDFVPFWDITATATNKKILFSGFEAALNHDALANYVADKHVAHAGVSIATAATSGISGGGTIAATRNLALNINGLTGESAIVAADTIPFYDATAGASRKVTLTELSTALGAADEKVKVDAAATAGYLGVAAGGGVLRTDSTIAWTDGGNFVTLAVAAGAGAFTTRYRGHLSADVDVVTNTYTKVVFDVEDFDGGGDAVNGTFTAPASGYYAVCVGSKLFEAIDAGKFFYVLIYLDGVYYAVQAMNNIGAGANVLDIKFSDIFYVASGQTIETYVWHNHGSNREIQSGTYTYMAIHRLS